MPIGAKVTLRKDRMYEFLDRLVNIALPRVRDFRGPRTRRASMAEAITRIGMKEHIIFPEIDYDKVEEVWAWTSSFARRRRPTTRHARCWQVSIFRFAARASRV